MSKVLLSFGIAEKLQHIYPDVEKLTIDTDDEIVSWPEVAKAFPNVKAIKIREVAKIAEQRTIDSDFFSLFPALESLITDKVVDTDFTNVNPNTLSHLSELNIGRSSSSDLSVLGELPNLKTLTITIKNKALRFYTQANSGLEKIKLTLFRYCHEFDIDLSAAPVTELKIDHYDEYRRDDVEAITIKALHVPSSLSKLYLGIKTASALPSTMLDNVSRLEHFWLEQNSGFLNESLFGNLSHVTYCRLKLIDLNAPIPKGLLSNLTEIERLYLEVKNAQFEQDFISTNGSIEELELRSDNVDMTPLFNTCLPKLKTANLHWHNEQPPIWLANSPELTSLNLLFAGDLSALPELPALTNCSLHAPVGEQLPAFIRHNSNLERLSLYHCAFSTLGDLNAMTSLKEFRIQPKDRCENQLPNVDSITDLPALESIYLDIHPTKINPVWLQLAPQVELNLWNDHLVKELSILRGTTLTFDQCLECANILVAIKKPAELPAMPAEFHLALMAAKYNRFKAQHKTWLREVAAQSEQQKPLAQDSIIFISGRSAFKAAELNQKSADLGFTISKKLDNKVTHVLLGSAPKSIELLDLERHRLIDETSLQHYFTHQAPKFLQQENSAAMGDTVLAMLASPDEASHQVAVQMLEQGGVTEAMRLPLFFILKTTSDNKLRKQIKELLAGMGDELFQLAVNDRILFNTCQGLDKYGRLMGQGVMVDKLKKQKKKWGDLLCNQFAKLYFVRFGEGLMFLMMQKETSAEQLDALSTLIDGDCLNWRRGAAFEQALAQFDEHNMVHYYRHINCSTTVNHDRLLGTAKTYLPSELTQNHTIASLDLGHCLLDALPKGIEHYRHVRRLDLSANALTKLPSDFALFSELEELSLSHNHFTAFPEVLLTLKNLKRLDLRCARKPVASDDYISTYTYQGGTSCEGPYRPIRAPQAFRDAFPDCEILEDALT
ncbi:hypothetical protein ACRZ5S_07340 [Vibrio scophthalmi]|uniref:leucine-rich repeat domain-containing protein n=1 Tax=Vibrio scophthalmi TaxID=45658 RepID=UPI003EBF3ADA